MGSKIKLDEIKRFEVTEVYAHPDAKVDIVLVHGLNGGPRTTWTAKNGVFWPTDLLPATLKSAKARILVYGYNADIYTFGSGKSASSDMIHQHAQSFLSNLSLERKSEEVSDHPIIFVAHSLGGILVKRALELSNDLTSKNADDNRSIYVSTYGIIFLGTPHNGADPAKWGLILQSMVSALVPKKVMETESQMIKTLQTNNETLQNINLHFLDIYQRFKICMVHEQDKTDLKGTKMLIVDQSSASPMLPDVVYFGIEATHSGMCKFESKNSPGYLNVSTTIKTWVQECLPTIQARWDMERKTRRQIREAQAAELLNIYPPPTSNLQTSANSPGTFDGQLQSRKQGLVQAPLPRTARFEFETAEVEEADYDMADHRSNSLNNSTIMVKSTSSIETHPAEHRPDDSTPFFIKPSGFRPNSLFVGREAELAELHKILFDKKRRADGTSAVLIQSMPGGGKTHLARQYVYDHREDFPGGIFWLRAKSQTELAAGFWDIARKAALKDSMANEDESSLKDPQQFIKLVRKWLKHRHDWLMVLDGIRFDDAEGLRQFIPDSRNTGIIYTSTEKSVSGDHHWMNPQIIKVPLLSAREAQQLLLLELDRKEPFLKDDLKHSMELVQSMGLLPVVIHAVAQRLKATDEPLGKFARSYATEPRLRGLGAYIAVIDQLKILGAYEALNLIYILCFFSQHIPVEMISLGLKALDVPARASEPITGRTLNNTFKILNMFALIDRNDHESSMHSSQSSKGSRDMLADNVDVLSLHSVVQGFFVDTLLGYGTLPMWLDRAVRVFCCSYDMANERITRKTNAGLVEDYRLYEIHGNRLQRHITKHRKRHPTLEEAALMLAGRLTSIKGEIERRTPESSQFIASERPDAFQTSIFDRTSSSSDTGPETPMDDRVRSMVSTWGFGVGKATLESPTSFVHHDIKLNPAVTLPSQFPLLPIPDDPGYDSDRESLAITLQPSQRTMVQSHGSPPGLDGAWEIVKNKKSRTKPARPGLPDHRTTRVMEKQRYRDSAGSFRSISKHAIDPRLSQETAQGFMNNSLVPSRGRLSGHSSAEVALAYISKSSPPPARGGGLVRDRSSSVRGAERRGMTPRTVSYAAAAAGTTTEPVNGYRKSVQPSMESEGISGSSKLSREARPPSSARASLQKFPVEITRSSPTPRSPLTPIALDSLFPGPLDQIYPKPDNAIYQTPGRYSQENLTLGLDPYASKNYPQITGPIPYETLQPSLSVSPRKRDLPHDYPAWHSQTYTEALPSSNAARAQNLSLSSPNIRSSDGTYYPGRPEFSELSRHQGYTSQPMSRDPSGQSTHSNRSTHSANAVDNHGRRHSLAETEPLPQLPVFSPMISPTSYQIYERMMDDRDLRDERDRGVMRKSPRLGFSRVDERLDEWRALGEEDDALKPRRQFDPTAPSFSPSPSSFTTYSPKLPSAPANSMFSNPSNTTSSFPSPNHRPANYSPLPVSHTSLQSFRHSPELAPHTPQSSHYSPPQPPHTTPQSSHYSLPQPPHTTPQSSHYSLPQPSHTTLQSFAEDGEQFRALEMGQTTSGGMRVGRRLVEFGDFPEPVDFDLARERADRNWIERERERELIFKGERAEGLGIRQVRR